MNKPDVFSTRDLYLAASLISLKYELIGIDYQIEGDKNQPVGYFKFENTPEIQQTKNQYMQALLLVEPKAFMTNLRALKSEIVNIYKNPLINNY